MLWDIEQISRERGKTMTTEEIENLRKVRMGEVLEEQLKEDANFVQA